jgi:hypothetical protein
MNVTSTRGTFGKRNQAEHEKKLCELRLMKWARRYSPAIPSRNLRCFEQPDWIMPQEKIGIEVSQLLPPKPTGALFSGPQLSEFQRKVVAKAQELYCARGGTPVDVLVFFANQWNKRNDLQEAAEALATFVKDNCPPARKTVTIEPIWRDDDWQWADLFNVVRICAIEGGWQAGGVASIELLSHAQVASTIAVKEALLPMYRNRLPGWQMWLLLTTRIPVLWTLSVPNEVKDWKLPTTFDKVLLLSWEHGSVFDVGVKALSQ